ncbi:amidohydrolase [Streptomyces rapamycinicus NRRL 5491]|uniref:Amidohydrolase n=3 Tax=Streptomyces rapamycinicus TaxID=1226757 RepID=A0A0A0NGK2_STRRN|nr:amidohydrolase [Streptomyces rapamycinicus NRRL 5491]MBB4781007.1 putative amidohydrolase YtcJ [Streptomyces rapamycinicus]RLV74347.1 amidohydrolase [Streptomyces rapamycinicus NRRL 5491]
MNDPAPAQAPEGRTVLLRGGEVHSPADPFATAMVVERGTVAWVGSEGAADGFADGVDEVIQLDGALVTPAFTDAHVHTTATGLALTGLDLTGARTLPDALERVRAHAAAHPADRVLLGHGWDAARWPEGRPPSRAELDQATGGRPLYLTRIDVHSAVVTTALLDLVPGVSDLAGYHPDTPLTGAAHHAVRAAAHEVITERQRADAQRAALARAASLGIGTLHECAGPDISSEDDLTGLLEIAAGEPGPRVYGYWAEAASSASDLDKVRELGAIGAAGDLFVDGALGSHTACLHQPYADTPHSGTAYLDAAAVAAHVTACTEAGIQAGFHAIGDAAVTAVVKGVRAAADTVGPARVRAARHRVEHAEMLTPETIAAFADLGLTASVQPAFDALWGGEDGMYAQRLGPGRARTLNPYAALLRAGVPLALGSDSPVTPLDPWGTVRAAAFHRTPEHRISVRAAFTAHTRGGWRAVGRDDAGVLAPGAPADYAIWRTGELIVQVPDTRVAGWSTDPRSGTPGLPDLTPGGQLPVCVRTVVGGRTVHLRPDE